MKKYNRTDIPDMSKSKLLTVTEYHNDDLVDDKMNLSDIILNGGQTCVTAKEVRQMPDGTMVQVIELESILQKYNNMNFEQLRSALRSQFEIMQAQSRYLFRVEVDRDLIFETYLNGFEDPEERQTSTCNCCKSFLRQYGSVVAVTPDGKRLTMWDINIEGVYKTPIESIKDYVMSLPITEVFSPNQLKLGTNKSFDPARNVTWTHFYVECDRRFKIDSIVASEYRNTVTSLKNGLERISYEAIDTMLELCKQNSLYRGKQYEHAVTEFKKLKEQYDKCSNQEDWLWWAAVNCLAPVTRIKSTAVGTLLEDLSDVNVDIDNAVFNFNKLMSPSNYQRPTSIATPRMREAARKHLADNNLLHLLTRRYAKTTDLPYNGVLFNGNVAPVLDVFSQLDRDQPVNAKTLTRVETISIEKFLELLPSLSALEVLFEDRHRKSLFTLTAGDPGLFKWNNGFAWSYNGGLADSDITKNVQNAGGKTDGELRFSIQWNTSGKDIVDLDAFCIEPNRARIYFGEYVGRKNSYSPMGGQLDVDMIAPKTVGVENINYPVVKGDGIYQFGIDVYSASTKPSKEPIQIELKMGSEVFNWTIPALKRARHVPLVKVERKNGELKLIMSPDGQTNKIASETVWGLKTNTFIPVTKVFLSPNFWENQLGNKHYFFALHNAKADEAPRPFYNEFLKPELSPHRKTMELVGSAIAVEPTFDQVSGLGFSETLNNEVIVKAVGSFTRLLKIQL